MVEAMDEFPSVVVGGTEIVVDQGRPVAAVVDPDGRVAFASWPDLPVGPVEPEPVLLPAPDSAWVFYPPATVALMDDSHEDALLDRDSPAVQVRPDASVSVVRLGDRNAIGATTGLLWTTVPRQQQLDDAYRGDPLPPDWEDPTLLVPVRPDGTTSELRVDRHVLAVFEERDLVHVLVAPTPPIAEHDGSGGTSYDYRTSEIALPVGEPLPTRLRFLDHHPDGLGPAVEPRRCWWTPHAWGMPPAPARTIDLADVPGSRWRRTTVLTPAQIADAIAAARGWFGDPNAYWRGEDGTEFPLASGVHDAEVHIEDEWPSTRVVITFRHHHWPEGRLRRSVRVFDDAGRLTSNPYADIHLMEDLDTAHLPSPADARDGHLDV
ncbi:hypothetical protein [Amnibacterium endophyticum]|uniref:DUF2169 domain-containing protein n=1 Tax=Amnibacterium endophyticum TaxID=2109337 RepID=A0ABW4LJF8_9MICO